MSYEFEKTLPKEQAHNVRHIEELLAQGLGKGEAMSLCSIYQEEICNHWNMGSMYPVSGRTEEVNRDSALYYQTRFELGLKNGRFRGERLLKESAESIQLLSRQDPGNVELPQLQIIQEEHEKAQWQEYQLERESCKPSAVHKSSILVRDIFWGAVMGGGLPATSLLLLRPLAAVQPEFAIPLAIVGGGIGAAKGFADIDAQEAHCLSAIPTERADYSNVAEKDRKTEFSQQLHSTNDVAASLYEQYPEVSKQVGPIAP